MSIQGKLTTQDNGTLTGFIADLTLDVDIKLVPIKDRPEDKPNYPDWRVYGATPRGRELELGGGWNKTSKNNNDYISVTVTAYGQKLYLRIWPNDEGIEWRVEGEAAKTDSEKSQAA